MDLQMRTDKLAELLEERLGVRGATFEVKLRRAGRLLPRHLRLKGRTLVNALAHTGHPKLLSQLDQAALDLAAHEIEQHLLKVNPWERRKSLAVNLSAGVAFNLLVVLAVTLVVIVLVT